MRNPFRRRGERPRKASREARPEAPAEAPQDPPESWEQAASAARERRRREREQRRRSPADEGGKRRRPRLPARRRTAEKRPERAPVSADGGRGAALRRAASKRVDAARTASARGLRATGARASGLTPHLRRAGDRAWSWLRRLLALLLRGAAIAERTLRRALKAAAGILAGAIELLGRWISPERASFAVVVAAAACLGVSQFMDYRGVEVGQPAYADVSQIAAPPQRARETPIDAHSVALLAAAVAATGLALLALLRRRWKLGRLVALCGVAAVGVILAIDMPRGLDEGDAQLQYEGARAVLNDAFYAQLAAAGGLILAGGLLTLDLRRLGRPAKARRRHRRPRSSRRKLPSLARSGT